MGVGGHAVFGSFRQAAAAIVLFQAVGAGGIDGHDVFALVAVGLEHLAGHKNPDQYRLEPLEVLGVHTDKYIVEGIPVHPPDAQHPADVPREPGFFPVPVVAVPGAFTKQKHHHYRKDGFVHVVGSSPAVSQVGNLVVYQQTDIGEILPDGSYQL